MNNEKYKSYSLCHATATDNVNNLYLDQSYITFISKSLSN